MCNDEISWEMVLKFGLYRTNDRTEMLSENFTKYLNINLTTDFNVNSNFNNDFLD